MNSDEYISLQEAATLLEVTATTLRNWDRKGKLRAIRHPLNKYRMYRLKEVLGLQRQLSLFPEPIGTKESDFQPSAKGSLSATELRRIVRSLHRILRDGEGNSSLIERFDELTKLLYCKLSSEKDVFDTNPDPFMVQPGDSDSSIAFRIRTFFAAQIAKKSILFPKRFASIQLRDKTIRQAVEILEPIRLSEVKDDLKGLAYEEVIRNTFEKGDNQQFFTPRTVAEFMVQMLGEAIHGVICDPACGTAGFLIYAEVFRRTLAGLKKSQLLGLEIDERLCWVAGINLEMAGASTFNIKNLSGNGSLGDEVKDQFGKIDIILTNPPFGSDMTDGDALQRLELGRNRQSRRRGVLFIERCLDLLKRGGILGIIIDDGVLNGPSNKDVRKLIFDRSDVFAVVSLPDTTFMPYASVKSSILFMQKKGGSQPRLMQNNETFFATADVVGKKPNGEPLLRVNPDTNKQELDNDLPVILQSWKNYETRAASNFYFWSKIKTIDDHQFDCDGFRLDAAYHHPSRHEAIEALQNSRYPLRSITELCDLRNDSIVPSKDLVDEDITYVGLANMEPHTGVCSPTIVPGISLKSSVKRFFSNDILFSKMRPELRKIWLAPDDLGEGFASSECLILIPKKASPEGHPQILPELLTLLLRSELVYGQIVHQVIGIGRPRLSKSAVLNVRIPIPPLKDQRKMLVAYQQSESSARQLLKESETAKQNAVSLISGARRQLLHELLRSE